MEVEKSLKVKPKYSFGKIVKIKRKIFYGFCL